MRDLCRRQFSAANASPTSVELYSGMPDGNLILFPGSFGVDQRAKLAYSGDTYNAIQ